MLPVVLHRYLSLTVFGRGAVGYTIRHVRKADGITDKMIFEPPRPLCSLLAVFIYEKTGSREMRKLLFVLLLSGVNSAYAATSLDNAIENVRRNCGNLSNELNHLKTMAGINTAVTAVGTVTGGVGLATGIAKSGVDSEIEKLEKELEELKKSRGDVPIEHLEIEDEALFNRQVAEFIASYQAKEQE